MKDYFELEASWISNIKYFCKKIKYLLQNLKLLLAASEVQGNPEAE